MKKLIGLIIGLMISVSAFANTGKCSEKEQQILKECMYNTSDLDRFNNVLECYTNMINILYEYVSSTNGAERGIKIEGDNFIHIQVDGFKYTMQIDNDELNAKIVGDYTYRFRFNANGNFSAVRQ